jgi:galactose mutarotase-like enzyme
MNTEISNDSIRVVVSDLGAELRSIIKDGHEYLWDGDQKYWSSRSLTLFPYVGRFTENSYLLHSRRYGMEIHGFARKLT